jgi:hypothetical protein
MRSRRNPWPVSGARPVLSIRGQGFWFPFTVDGIDEMEFASDLITYLIHRVTCSMLCLRAFDFHTFDLILPPLKNMFLTFFLAKLLAGT